MGLERFRKVSISTLRDAGARLYCWFPPGELPEAPHGAFAFLFREKDQGASSGDVRDIFFPVAGLEVVPDSVDTTADLEADVKQQVGAKAAPAYATSPPSNGKPALDAGAPGSGNGAIRPIPVQPAERQTRAASPPSSGRPTPDARALDVVIPGRGPLLCRPAEGKAPWISTELQLWRSMRAATASGCWERSLSPTPRSPSHKLRSADLRRDSWGGKLSPRSGQKSPPPSVSKPERRTNALAAAGLGGGYRKARTQLGAAL